LKKGGASVEKKQERSRNAIARRKAEKADS
jgi:hypothetical protein